MFGWVSFLKIMIQEFKDHGRCQMMSNFGICSKELGGSKLRVFMHACAASALLTDV